MLPDKTFYGLGNWKCYHSQVVTNSGLPSFKKDQIQKENQKGYMVIFIENSKSAKGISVECYKKHATAILKSILIGKFPIPVYNDFKAEIDSLVQQTKLLQDAISKPEYFKYSLQKKLYFNLD